MVIDRIPRTLRATNHHAQNQHQSEIFNPVQGCEPRVIDRRVREQILVRKQRKSVKENPSGQQEKKSQARSVGFLVGSIQMWPHHHRRHERNQVQKQRRISYGTVWHVAVPQNRIIHINPLVQRPESITDRNKYPKYATTLRSLDRVLDSESGRQKKQQEVNASPVRGQLITESQAKGEDSFDRKESE